MHSSKVIAQEDVGLSLLYTWRGRVAGRRVVRLASMPLNCTGLLFPYVGTDPSLDAMLLTSHMDVVPVENASRWEHPPFSANMDGEFIYGRGTLDDKVRQRLPGHCIVAPANPSLHAPGSRLQFGIFCILENLEDMLRKHGPDYRPKRTIIVALGHDEEVSGNVSGDVWNTRSTRVGSGSLPTLLAARFGTCVHFNFSPT